MQRENEKANISDCEIEYVIRKKGIPEVFNEKDMKFYEIDNQIIEEKLFLFNN